MNSKDIKIHLLSLTEKEQAMLGRHPYTEEIALEAAMCAWEATWNADAFEWEDGAGQLRLCCGALAQAIHIGYCIAAVDDQMDGHAYDWDFVPWFILNCVVWNNHKAFIYGNPDLHPDWVEKCRRPDFLPEPEPELSDEDLLRSAVKIFNTIPNQHGSYDLAAKIDRRLNK